MNPESVYDCIKKNPQFGLLGLNNFGLYLGGLFAWITFRGIIGYPSIRFFDDLDKFVKKIWDMPKLISDNGSSGLFSEMDLAKSGIAFLVAFIAYTLMNFIGLTDAFLYSVLVWLAVYSLNSVIKEKQFNKETVLGFAVILNFLLFTGVLNNNDDLIIMTGLSLYFVYTFLVLLAGIIDLDEVPENSSKPGFIFYLFCKRFIWVYYFMAVLYMISRINSMFIDNEFAFSNMLGLVSVLAIGVYMMLFFDSGKRKKSPVVTQSSST